MRWTTLLINGRFKIVPSRGTRRRNDTAAGKKPLKQTKQIMLIAGERSNNYSKPHTETTI